MDNGGEKNGDAFDDELFTALCSGFYVHFRFPPPPPPPPLPPADPQPSLSSFHLLFTSSLPLSCLPLSPICSPHLPSPSARPVSSFSSPPDFICSPGIPFQLLACLLTHTVKCVLQRCSNFFHGMKFDAVLARFFPPSAKIFHFRSPSRIRTYTRAITGRDTFFFFFFPPENRGHATHKSRETVGFYDETYPFSLPPSRGNEGKTNRYAPPSPSSSRNSIERRSFADCNCESV